MQIKERIINVSSISAGGQMDWSNLEGERRYSADAQYATSKACSLRAQHSQLHAKFRVHGCIMMQSTSCSCLS